MMIHDDKWWWCWLWGTEIHEYHDDSNDSESSCFMMMIQIIMIITMIMIIMTTTTMTIIIKKRYHHYPVTMKTRYFSPSFHQTYFVQGRRFNIIGFSSIFCSSSFWVSGSCIWFDHHVARISRLVLLESNKNPTGMTQRPTDLPSLKLT